MVAKKKTKRSSPKAAPKPTAKPAAKPADTSIKADENVDVKKIDEIVEVIDTGISIPALPEYTPPAAKPAQAKEQRAFVKETPQTDDGYDIYDEIEALIDHVESISSADSHTVYVDGIDHLRRDDRTLPHNHMVKRIPYYFLWARHKDIVGNKVKSYNLVTREVWKMLQDKYKCSIKVDHSPSENYIRNGDCVLAVIKYDNWLSLQQQKLFKTAMAAKKQEAERRERSKRIAMHVEETGDMDYAANAYESDSADARLMEAQSRHVAGGFTEDMQTIMKRLESGEALSPDEMSKAMGMASTAKATRDINFK